MILQKIIFEIIEIYYTYLFHHQTETVSRDQLDEKKTNMLFTHKM